MPESFSNNEKVEKEEVACLVRWCKGCNLNRFLRKGRKENESCEFPCENHHRCLLLIYFLPRSQGIQKKIHFEVNLDVGYVRTVEEDEKRLHLLNG